MDVPMKLAAKMLFFDGPVVDGVVDGGGATGAYSSGRRGWGGCAVVQAGAPLCPAKQDRGPGSRARNPVRGRSRVVPGLRHSSRTGPGAQPSGRVSAVIGTSSRRGPS